VTGAEALIRWQHPDKGLLAPAAFLPVIEDHPLAVEVGEWVIDTALTQIEQWQAAGLDMPVSVNIGARQLQQGNFVPALQAILAQTPTSQPGKLELEVLETSALADMVQVAQVIEDCAQMGVKFALDDFGTGYSSLTYLKRLQVALLKIDQSFVRDMLDDPDDLAILQGVIRPGWRLQARSDCRRRGNGSPWHRPAATGLRTGTRLWHCPAHAARAVAGLGGQLAA
jgi:EAL domain-containing protein (putative c-di-GMP-specific phosphodiesterase class I)